MPDSRVMNKVLQLLLLVVAGAVQSATVERVVGKASARPGAHLAEGAAFSTGQKSRAKLAGDAGFLITGSNTEVRLTKNGGVALDRGLVLVGSDPAARRRSIPVSMPNFRMRVTGTVLALYLPGRWVKFICREGTVEIALQSLLGESVTLQAGDELLVQPTAKALPSPVQVDLGRLADTSTLTVSGGTASLSTFSDTVGTVQLVSGSITGSTGILTSTTAHDVRSGSVSAILGGTAGLTKTTAGTVSLTAANTYTGTTAVKAGTLQLTGGNNRIAPAGGVALGDVGSSGTLILGDAGGSSNQTLTSLTTAGDGGKVVGGNASVSILTTNIISGTSFYAGVLGGVGANENNLALSKTGAGTMELGLGSSYTGGTSVAAGTLKLSASSAAGTGALTLSAGSVISGSGTTQSNSIVIGTATSSQTVFGATTTLVGWDFNGQTGFGPSPLSASSVVGAGLTGTPSLTRGSGVTTTGGSSNGWGGDGWDISNTTAASAIAANDFASFSLTVSANNALNLDGFSAYNVRRSGTGPTTGLWQYQVGGGSFVDIGSPITWGGTTSSAGNPEAQIDLASIPALQGLLAGSVITFRVVNYGSTGAAGSWYLNNFQTGNDFAINGKVGTVNFIPASGSGTLGIDTGGITTFSGPVTVNNTASLTAASGGTASFTNVISGPGSITKTGAGDVVLSASNTYTGTTTISEGALTLSGNGALADTSSVNLTSNTSSFSIAAISALSEGVASLSGVAGSQVNLGSKTLITVGDADATFSGVADGAGGITKQGTGKLTLNGVNTYTGTTTVLGGGTLLLGADSTLNVGSKMTLSGGTLAAGGKTNSLGEFSQTTGVNIIDFAAGDGNLTFNSTGTWSGTLSVWNYTGAIWAGGTDKLFFASSSLSNEQLSMIQFFTGSGTGAIGSGSSFLGTELVPVPEPGAMLTGLLLLGLVGYRERKPCLRRRAVGQG